MQTIKFNKKALAAVAGAFLLFVCALSYLPTAVDSQNPAVVRDVRFRKESKLVYPFVDVIERIHINTMINESKSSKMDSSENFSTDLQNDENGIRREKIKKMMIHAWNGYKNYSWGANEVRPISKTTNNQAIFGGRDVPATIIDAADTLWIMGLTNEYKEARDYIEAHFDMNKATGTISVFETTIRFLGGLLSLYALTKEDFYINKAKGVAEALLPAFNTPSGIPMSSIDMKTKYAQNYNWANGGSSILAEYGSLHLEFVYLSHVSKSPLFKKKVVKIRDVLDKAEKVRGLYPNYINADTGKWTLAYHMSLGALGDSFYEYLLKSWIQSGKKDEQARKMYWDVSEAIRKQMVFKSKSGLTYIAELHSGSPDHKMGHLACFCVGMFSLQAVYEKTEENKRSTMEFAEELGKTCHESYVRTDSNIGPEMFYFNNEEDATSRHGENGYILRPEVIEGFFYLWRLTGKSIYREWVWDALVAIEKHCKVEGGYAGLHNVYDPGKGYDDVQQSFFLAETLKYGYLTFTDTSIISLDEWVFNTEAHPLPIMN